MANFLDPRLIDEINEVELPILFRQHYNHPRIPRGVFTEITFPEDITEHMVEEVLFDIDTKTETVLARWTLREHLQMNAINPVDEASPIKPPYDWAQEE